MPAKHEQSLKRIEVGEEQLKADASCSVCLCDFELKEEALELPCGRRREHIATSSQNCSEIIIIFKDARATMWGL